MMEFLFGALITILLAFAAMVLYEANLDKKNYPCARCKLKECPYKHPEECIEYISWKNKAFW